MDSEIARKTFELENGVMELDTSQDHIYYYDKPEQDHFLNTKPWIKDPHYFKEVKISSVALIKMATHARSGGNIEVMGLMQGKVKENMIVVMDAFALPVEGTETRVNAQAEGYEYMVDYVTKIKEVGRQENVVGWYHSHPGYGCWLSGIDVSTQNLNQQYQEPFVAVVVDPVRSISAGKVDIGAFRTYPQGYTPPDDETSEYQSIPLNKIEDFGVHCKEYYALEISYFKSTMDEQLLELLWNKYWANSLSQSPLITNREYYMKQIKDLAEKVAKAETSIVNYRSDTNQNSKKGEGILAKLTRDSSKICCENGHSFLNQVLKMLVFSPDPCQRNS